MLDSFHALTLSNVILIQYSLSINNISFFTSSLQQKIWTQNFYLICKYSQTCKKKFTYATHRDEPNSIWTLKLNSSNVFPWYYFFSFSHFYNPMMCDQLSESSRLYGQSSQGDHQTYFWPFSFLLESEPGKVPKDFMKKAITLSKKFPRNFLYPKMAFTMHVIEILP